MLTNIDYEQETEERHERLRAMAKKFERQEAISVRKRMSRGAKRRTLLYRALVAGIS